MKIMHFIHGLNTGGAETLVKNYVLNFDKKKNDIVVLCLGHEPRSPYEKQLKDAGIRMIFVEDRNRFKNKILNRCNRYLIIRKIIKEEAPDVLHLHLMVNRFVKFANPSENTRLFYTIHSEPRKLWLNGLKKQKRDYKAAQWLVKKRGMRMLALHDEMRKEVNKMFGVNNAIVLNNGVDIGRIKKARSKAKVKEELKIPEDAFVIGHVGRLSEVKNQKFLVDVCERIGGNVFLLMVGEGQDKTKIEERLKKAGLSNRSLILPSCSNIGDLFAVMDVFAFPSLWEGLGVALIEAQVAELPCFVSKGVPESATISNLVIRLSLGDGPKKWAEAILNYRKPKKVIVESDGWDIKKVTKKLEQVYQEAIEE